MAKETQTEIPVETPEESKPSFLEEVKAERIALEKVRDELKELKSIEILSGKADAGQTIEEKKEETPKEYAEKVMRGEITE